MKTSLCMITWNEEELLPVAIKSAKGLADEIIVVDTGSTDGTLDIAKQHGARVVMFADRYNKGQSRNTALTRATGDWCVILDADERIADPEGVRAFLETTDAQAVYIKLAYVDADGSPTLSYPQMRCWRKGTYLYKYRAHEVPVPTAGWGKLAHTDFIWEHRPPPDRAWKREYTLKRLLLDVEENPDAARPLYYLGRQYMYLGQWEESIKILEKYIASSGRHDQADAWHCMAKCHARLGDKQQQTVPLFQACAEQPHRRLWWGELANLYHVEGKDEIAVGLLRCLLELPLSQRTYTSHIWYGSHPYDLLARCLWKLQRYKEGHEWAKKALEFSPDDARLKKNLQFFIDIMEAKKADYYNHVYEKTDSVNKSLTVEVAKRINGQSVLDLGCGVGFLASLTEGEYLGIDFSSVALDKAHRLHGRDGAKFLQADIYALPPLTFFDTVVLQEVLEHLDDPSSVVEEACILARHRVIVTVPKNMPDPAHVNPRWTEQDIQQLLGNEVQIESHGRYWIAVKDM